MAKGDQKGMCGKKMMTTLWMAEGVGKRCVTLKGEKENISEEEDAAEGMH